MKLIFDKNELQALQDSFCVANHVCTQLWTIERKPCTTFSGSHREESELQQIREYITWEKQREELQHCLIENLIEENTGREDCCCCLIPVKEQGETVAYWEVFGVTDGKEAQMTEDEFWQSAKLLSVISTIYFSAKAKEYQVECENIRIRNIFHSMECQVNQKKLLYKILEIAIQKKPFAEILNEITAQAGKFWGLTSTGILQLNPQENKVELISFWNKKTMETQMQREWCLKDIPFLTGRSYLISSETTVPEKFTFFLEKYNIRAIVALPIYMEEQLVMYLFFAETEKNRIWEKEELVGFQQVREVIEQILRQRIEKNSLTGSYKALEQVLTNMNCGVYVVQHEEQQVLYVNSMLKSLFNQNLEQMQQEILAIPSNHKQAEIYISKEEQWLEVHQTTVQWIHGEHAVLGTVYDITDKKNYQLLIEREANHDFLTGLFNRRRLEEDLKEAVSHVKEVEMDGALLYLDLDDFKYINEGLGHQYGDTLIKSIAKKLCNIHGLAQSCYRVGGDEFMIIIMNCQYMDLNHVLEEIRCIFAKPFLLKNTEYYCTMSMGVTRFPLDGEEVSELIKKADIALYEAKRQGKDRIEYYDNTVESGSIKRLDMEKNMRQAVRNQFDEFEIYYQPIVDATKAEHPCEGAEALIRWNSKELGMISPVEFIPLAEYIGLIIPIGDYILRQACKQCKSWNELGHPEYKVNVNLSIIQLLQNDIVDTIRNSLEESKLNPQNLILEVTEGLAVNDMVRMKHVLEDIRQLGVRVALDDFGTGYSSLNHVREMPIDIIKIDRCFVMDIGQDDYSGVFVKIVRELAETLHMFVCVEGVETDKQYQILKKIGVDLIQGYYFDKPMKAEEFETKYL